MDLVWLGRGVMLGFSIAAPVGPIGMLVIRHSLMAGRTAGLMTGLGAAVADAAYGLAGGLGLGGVAALVSHAAWLRLAGGGFLLWLGIRTLASTPIPVPDGSGRPQRSHGGRFATGLVLTLANPLTLMSFAAMFAGLGAGSGPVAPGWLVAGVFVGSTAWWVLLSAVASMARNRMTPGLFRWVNRGSGLVLAGFGTAALFAAMAD